MTTEMRRLKGCRGEIGRGAESRGGLEEQRGDEKRGVGHCRASHRGAEIRGGGNLLIRRRRAGLLPPLHVASGVPGHQGGARSERSSRWKVEPWRWERRGRREEHNSGEEIMFSLFFTVKRCCRLDRGS